MKIKIDMTPTTGLINSWRNDTRITAEMVVAELVDNSLDSGAQHVEVTVYCYKNGRLSGIKVRDDGTGIRDIESAMRLAQSQNYGAYQRLGRYGIALKIGPARLGQLLTIKSVHANHKLDFSLDWKQLEDSGIWTSEPDVEKGNFGPTFTEVCIRSIYRHRLRHWADLGEKLARTFAPALQSGREILFQDNPLVYTPITGLEDKIECDGQTEDGLQFHLIVGIMPEGKRANQGFSLTWGHRVLVDSWTPKFLAHCATTRLHGEITLTEIDPLGSSWILNQFKDDIESWQRDSLEKAIEPLVAPLIEKLKDEGLELRIRSIETFFEHFLNDGTEMAQEKGPNPIPGPVIGQRTGTGTRTRGKSSTSGDAIGKRDSTGKEKPHNPEISFRIRWEKNFKSENLWRIQASGDILIFWVNLLHPRGIQLKNPDQKEQLICVVAMALASYLTSRPNYQKEYPFLTNDTPDVHEAMTQNVSRWLRHATIV